MSKLEDYNRSRVTRDYTLADAMRDELLRQYRRLEWAARQLDANATMLWEDDWPLGQFPTLAELLSDYDKRNPR